MKVRFFTAHKAHDLEEQINEFISQTDMEVLGMDFTTTGSTYAVMLTYKTVGEIQGNRGFID
jgi:hypothetical protein